MNQLDQELRQVILARGSRDLSEFVHDKGNAKLGDAFVNLIYSLAKSMVASVTTGVKVSDLILAEAYRKSKWHTEKILKIKGKKGRIADYVEALVLYFWIVNEKPIFEFVQLLTEQLKADSFSHPNSERESAITAFQFMLNELYQENQNVGSLNDK